MATQRENVKAYIRHFSNASTGVTRHTLAGAMSLPINSIAPRVKELLNSGDIRENGIVHVNGRPRALLWTA